RVRAINWLEAGGEKHEDYESRSPSQFWRADEDRRRGDTEAKADRRPDQSEGMRCRSEPDERPQILARLVPRIASTEAAGSLWLGRVGRNRRSRQPRAIFQTRATGLRHARFVLWCMPRVPGRR